MENHAENVHQKKVPFLILLNNHKTAIACKKLFLKDILKEDYQKALKKVTLFFLSNSVFLNGQNYKKRVFELVTSHSSGYETSSKILLCMLYII